MEGKTNLGKGQVIGKEKLGSSEEEGVGDRGRQKDVCTDDSSLVC